MKNWSDGCIWLFFHTVTDAQYAQTQIDRIDIHTLKNKSTNIKLVQCQSRFSLSQCSSSNLFFASSMCNTSPPDGKTARKRLSDAERIWIDLNQDFGHALETDRIPVLHKVQLCGAQLPLMNLKFNLPQQGVMTCNDPHKVATSWNKAVFAYSMKCAGLWAVPSSSCQELSSGCTSRARQVL